ncbi:hypothetical protein RND81_04G009100 [Saponaria officinalis]|uniref:RING-type E3 ubiquitin transferase n=1 Tax=Saponaria officinalis TaxID=3572 RepID=A0AAW1LFD6_SAPOF
MDESRIVAVVLYLAFYLFLIFLFLFWMYSTLNRWHLFRSNISDRRMVRRPTFARFLTNHELTSGLDESVIETFPKFLYMGMDVDMDIGIETKMTGECVICLGIFEKNETLRLLPKCGHVYHVNCIDIWLQFHNTCPFCRANLSTDGGHLQKMSTRLEDGTGVVDSRNMDTYG